MGYGLKESDLENFSKIQARYDETLTETLQ